VITGCVWVSVPFQVAPASSCVDPWVRGVRTHLPALIALVEARLGRVATGASEPCSWMAAMPVGPHLANLARKLGAHSELEALSIAIREGILPGHGPSVSG
jgi:hypothetical protein